MVIKLEWPADQNLKVCFSIGCWQQLMVTERTKMLKDLSGQIRQKEHQERDIDTSNLQGNIDPENAHDVEESLFSSASDYCCNGHALSGGKTNTLLMGLSFFLPRKGENIEISNVGAVETSVSRASAILGNFLTPRLNPSWPHCFTPSTFLTTTFVCHLRAIAKHQKRDGFCHHCDTSVQSEFLLLATLAQHFFPHLDPDLLVVCASSRSRVPLVLWEILGFFLRLWHSSEARF